MKSIYLKLADPNLPGESSDREHSQWIELFSWVQEIAQPSSRVASTSGGHTVGRAEHEDMLVMKHMDTSSPLLYQAVSGGTTFKSAQIDFYRDAGDGKRVKYLEIQLKNVLVSRVRALTSENMLPVEEVSLRYSAIQWKYQKQNIDGSQGGAVLGAWNLATNTRTFQ